MAVLMDCIDHNNLNDDGDGTNDTPSTPDAPAAPGIVADASRATCTGIATSGAPALPISLHAREGQICDILRGAGAG